MSILRISPHHATIDVFNTEPGRELHLSTEATRENRQNLKLNKRVVPRNADSQGSEYPPVIAADATFERAAVIAADALRRRNADGRALSWMKRAVHLGFLKPDDGGPLDRSLKNAYVEASRGLHQTDSVHMQRTARAGQLAKFIYALGRTKADVVFSEEERTVTMRFSPVGTDPTERMQINDKIAKRLEKVLTQCRVVRLRLTIDFGNSIIDRDVAPILIRAFVAAGRSLTRDRLNLSSVTYADTETETLMTGYLNRMLTNPAPTSAIRQPA